MALRSRGRWTSGRAVRIRAVLPWCRQRRSRAGDQRPGRPEEQRSDTRRHSHPLSLIICASSMINFPSLYFWLDSKACSCNRRAGRGSWWAPAPRGATDSAAEAYDTGGGRPRPAAVQTSSSVRDTRTHTHTNGSARLGWPQGWRDTRSPRALIVPAAKQRPPEPARRHRDTERAAPGGGAGGRWEGR